MNAGAIRTAASRIVWARFARGDTVDDIAADYGVSRRAVYRWVEDRGVGRPSRPSRTVAGRIVAHEKGRVAS